MKADRYIINPELRLIKKNWKGNPITVKDRFLNHEFPYIPKFFNILEWKLKEGNNNKAKKADGFRLEPHFPKSFFETKDDGIVWLGHASFLIRIDNLTMIIDPVLSSPSFLMKRYVSFPFDSVLLKNIDLILLSHDHRDHCDEKSIKRISSLNPEAIIYTGLNMKPLVSSWCKNKITEAGWYQVYPKLSGIEITFLPTRHWGKRLITDTNIRLWGSFLIQSKDKIIYFGGDSGYGSHFKETAELFPNIDYAMLGIGAYKPEWFMHPSHTSPSDAYKAALDLKTKNLIPMHYGTFDLSDETISEPIESLRNVHQDQSNDLALLDVEPGVFIKM